MTAWRQSTPASDLWTVVLSSQTQLYPAPLSTHMWTPRLHPQWLLDHPSGLQVFTAVAQSAFWRQTWRQDHGGPGSGLKVIWAENSRVMGTRGMILKEWCTFYVGIWGKHAWTKAREDLKYGALQSGRCRNDYPGNFLMSPNAPKETGGKIKGYTPPRQTALDLLWTQEISITSTSQKIIQERGHKSFWQKNSNNCK